MKVKDAVTETGKGRRQVKFDMAADFITQNDANGCASTRTHALKSPPTTTTKPASAITPSNIMPTSPTITSPTQQPNNPQVATPTMALERPTETETPTTDERPELSFSDDEGPGDYRGEDDSDCDSSDDGSDEYIMQRLRRCPWTGEPTTRCAESSSHRNTVVVSAPRSLVGADEAARPKHQQDGVVGERSAPVSKTEDEDLHERFKETCRLMSETLKDEDFWNDNFDVDGISEDTMKAIFGDNLWPLELDEDEEVNALPARSVIKVAIDSGAADHVINPEDVPGHSVVPSAGSKAGKHFLAAGGHRIPNQGQLNLMVSGEGFAKRVKSTFQAAPVTRPLLSVSKICDSGCKVLFDKDRATIRKDGRNVGTFVRRGGLYVAELMVQDPDRPADFPRPGVNQ